MSELAAGEFESLLRFIEATSRRINALTECQKHEDARRVEISLQGLYATVREQAPVYGYIAELVLPQI